MPNRSYKAVFFDLDGTLLDTTRDLALAVNHTLAAFGMPELSPEQVIAYTGNGIVRLMEQSVPAGTPRDVWERAFEEFKRYYGAHALDPTLPYAGVPECVAALRAAGVAVAVVSNKADYAVKILCEDYFDGQFDFSVGELEGRRRKPYPDSVDAVMENFRIAKKDAVYIGDSEVDAATARNAGMDCILVSWGFRERELLASYDPIAIADQPSDIWEILNQ